jgi:hypothetical protein
MKQGSQHGSSSSIEFKDQEEKKRRKRVRERETEKGRGEKEICARLVKSFPMGTTCSVQWKMGLPRTCASDAAHTYDSFCQRFSN